MATLSPDQSNDVSANPNHEYKKDMPPGNPSDTTSAETSPTIQSSPNNNYHYDSPTASPQTPISHHGSLGFLSYRQHSLNLDDNDFANSPGSVRSYSSQTSTGGRRSLVLSRPAGMKERMQQRLRTAQSERNLLISPRFLPDDDDRSSIRNTRVGTMRRRGSGGGRMALQSPSLVREQLSKSWSNLSTVHRIMETIPPPITETNEVEKERMEQKQDMQEEHDSAFRRFFVKSKQGQAPEQPLLDHDGPTGTSKPNPSMMSSSSSLSAASAMLELQAKLDMAMSKISRLEQEQAHHDDLEDKYHDAQMMIAHLRIQSASTHNGRRLSGASADTIQSLLSDSQCAISKDQGETLAPMPFNNNAVGEMVLKAPDSTLASSLLLKDHVVVGRPRAGSMDDATATTTSSTPQSENVMELDDALVVVEHSRSQKLQKLKEFRKSRESQLKELVLDSQSSPTDVQSVIRNLQDELNAAKHVIEQQRGQLKQLQEHPVSGQETILIDENVVADDNTAGSEGSSIVHDNNELSTWRGRFRELQQKYIKLEMDRAWSEFQLRDRITNDALKFHKRLRHWKEQTEELQRQLEESMDQHNKETKDLRIQLSRQEQVALAAEQDLQEYKTGMQQTLKEYSISQDRLAKATALLAMYHSERSSSVPSNDPTIIQQAQFVEKALERKEVKNASWSTGWIGKIRQRAGETAHDS